MANTLFFEGPPPAFSEVIEEMPMERQAKLLETGEYPDKQLTLTESDLDEIAARFSACAAALPVKVEHTDSPLDPLGRVVRVWREGAALLATLAFPEDLAGFLRRRGAAKLSVGLSREPLALQEVSLVLKPRIATATLMGAESSAGAGGLYTEIVRLRAELTAREVDAQVALFRAQGRILPAAESAARVLLSLRETAGVTLSGGSEPAAQVFQRFLEAMPPAVVFGEAAASTGEADTDGFTHYEHTFLSKRLGVDPAKVAALIRQEQHEKNGGKVHAY